MSGWLTTLDNTWIMSSDLERKLRCQGQTKSPPCWKTTPSPSNELTMSSHNLDRIAAAVLPALKSVQRAVVESVSEFSKVYDCMESNLSNINENLAYIGDRQDSIQTELLRTSQSLKHLETIHEQRAVKVAMLETTTCRSADIFLQPNPKQKQKNLMKVSNKYNLKQRR